jgi:hypothetical protein
LEDSQLKPLIVKDKRLTPLHYVQSLTTWQADRKEVNNRKNTSFREKYLLFFPLFAKQERIGMQKISATRMTNSTETDKSA